MAAFLLSVFAHFNPCAVCDLGRSFCGLRTVRQTALVNGNVVEECRSEGIRCSNVNGTSGIESWSTLIYRAVLNEIPRTELYEAALPGHMRYKIVCTFLLKTA
uniref:Putative secreted protein n=1 Tax=Anopheles darlingi TaxID=43151 RepID=A0A2M4D4E5_ANODA